jgi:hypothetical protein
MVSLFFGYNPTLEFEKQKGIQFAAESLESSTKLSVLPAAGS